MRLRPLVLALALMLTDAASSPYSQWPNGPSPNANFFPIGVWLQIPSRIEQYQRVGVNTFVGFWGELDRKSLDEFARAKMPLFVKPNGIAYTSKPQNQWIAGWAQEDEPDNSRGHGPCIPASTLVSRYNAIKSEDKTRPVFLNFGRGVADVNWRGRGSCTGDTNYYAQAAAAGDILAFDIYPVGDYNGRLELIAEGLRNLRSWIGPEKIIWNFIQAGSLSGEDPTSPEQVKSEAWMSLIHGSQGIVYYVHQFKPKFREDGVFNYPKVVEAMSTVDQEIASLAPVLNSPTISNAIQVTTRPSTIAVDIMVKRYGGSIYVFSIAMRNRQTSATFSLPGFTESSVEALGENRVISMKNGRYTDAFSPYGVHIYRIAEK